MFALLLSVSCVAADSGMPIQSSDENADFTLNDQLDSQDNIAIEDALLEENKIASSSPNEWYVDGSRTEDGNGSADNPFNNLKSSIDQSKEGDTIYIAPGTYKGAGLNVNLSIDKDLNLVNSGAGEVIFDGENSHQIFNVSAYSLNITGLTFTHGYSEGYGGAIYFSNGLTDSKIDASFIENNAQLGGAIYFNGDISNNIFTGLYLRNEVRSNGGAMLVVGIATNNIFSADFRENRGKGYYGGAIHFTGQTSNNKFLGNYIGNSIVEGSGGGIVFDWDVNNTVFLANFSNNRVKEFPSAAFEVYGTFYNSTLGGYFENNIESAVLLSGCVNCTFNATFINNSARHGGILSLEHSINCYINCTFINNHAQRGGAINIVMDVINTTIGGVFINNTSTRLGGAIAIYPYINTRNYTFENVTIRGVFINNTAKLYGGAVYLESCSGIVFNGSTFEDNSAKNGGAIYLLASEVEMDSCNFTNNNATEGGAIFSNGSFDLTDCLFENNTADELGGAVSVEGNFSDSQIKSTFINNHAFNGGAIYMAGIFANNTITSYFENNSAERAGGAIFLRGAALNNTFISEFYGNDAIKASGGGIFFNGYAEGNDFESSFIHNHALYGAGMFFYKDAKNNRFGDDFRFNVAESCGGAIFFYSPTDGNNFSGQFISNAALGKIDKTNGNGGAITFKGTSSNSVFDCDFINNVAILNGGGVNYRQTPYNITFNGNFINNSARFGGGVNFFVTSENVVFNGEFIGNNATYGGGIHIEYGQIENTSFINNTAAYGGAIYFNGTGTVKNVDFINNSAREGGAIFTDGNLLVENAVFMDNHADDGTNQISLNKLIGTVTLVNVSPEYIGPYKIAKLTVMGIDTDGVVNITANVIWKGQAVVEGNVVVAVNNKEYSAKVEKGIAVVEIPDLPYGVYEANVTFDGKEYYNNPSQSVTIDARKDTKIIAPNRVIYVAEAIDGYEYQFILKDGDGKALAGKEVSVSFNGKNQTVSTDEKGWGTVTLNADAEGTYYAAISFAGDDTRSPAAQNGTIKLVKQKTSIVAPNRAVSVTQAVNGYVYQFILKDSNGNPLAGKKVSVSFNGKTQTVTTDEKGWGTVTLKANAEGTYNVVMTFAGDNAYTKVSQSATINLVREKTSFVAPDRVVKVGEISKGYAYSAILKDVNGKVLANKKVLFTFNGKKQLAITNEKGWATVILTANSVGTQSVTIKFAGDRYYRETIAVRTIKIV